MNLERTNETVLLSLQMDYLKYLYSVRNIQRLNLFEIIKFGHFEPIHTKFMYWLMGGERHSYRDKYVREFLSSIKVNIGPTDMIEVHSEQGSGLNEDYDEPRWIADIIIEIHSKEKDKPTQVIIENKIYDELTFKQVSGEITHYKLKEGDVFVALMPQSKKWQYDNVHNEIIEKRITIGVNLQFYSYSDWLKLNERFDGFDREDQDKVKHLNDNIRRLIDMDKFEAFGDAVLHNYSKALAA
jgi:hypothetical protein